MSEPLMIRLLSASVAVANRSGRIIREVLRSGQLGVVQKGYDDPQTEADRRVERCIVATLTTRFPNIMVIGEENIPPTEGDMQSVVTEDAPAVLQEKCPPDLTSVEEKDVVVWVDPLDGTGEFTKGFYEDVTVLVGIAVQGKPVAGVIHQPFYGSSLGRPANELGRTVWGMLGLGVRGHSPSPSPSSAPASGPRLAVTRSHNSEMVKQVTDSLQPSKVIQAGGAGNKMLMVLEGVVDAYVYPSTGTKKWDTCAGDALIQAAGGIVTDLHGRSLTYQAVSPAHSPGEESSFVSRCKNKHGLIVTMRGLSQLRAKLPANVLEAFPLPSN